MDQYKDDDMNGSPIDQAMNSLSEMGIEIDKPNEMSDDEFNGIITSEV